MTNSLVLYMLITLDKFSRRNYLHPLNDEDIEIPYQDTIWKHVPVSSTCIKSLVFDKFIGLKELLFGCFERSIKPRIFSYYKMLLPYSSYCRSNKIKGEELLSCDHT